MLWIMTYQNLPDHPKTLAAAHILGIDPDLLVGKLIRFWTWALTYREDGFFAEYEASLIADKMRWGKSPKKLMEALLNAPVGFQSGFMEPVDGGFRFHDWQEYVGKLAEKRRKDRERKSSSKRESGKNSTGIPTENPRNYGAESSAVPSEAARSSRRNINNNNNQRNSSSGSSACAREGFEPNITETDKQVQSLSDYYQQNGGVANTAVHDSIRYYLEHGFEPETVRRAITKGALDNKRWPYVDGILRNWESAGLRTAAQVQAAEADHSARQRRSEPEKHKPMEVHENGVW